jgi:sensor histidine kinase YesM
MLEVTTYGGSVAITGVNKDGAVTISIQDKGIGMTVEQL